MSDLMWMISNNLINVVDVLFSVLIPWIMVETKRKKDICGCGQLDFVCTAWNM